MVKKLISIVLALVLVLGVLCVNISAESIITPEIMDVFLSDFAQPYDVGLCENLQKIYNDYSPEEKLQVQYYQKLVDAIEDIKNNGVQVGWEYSPSYYVEFYTPIDFAATAGKYRVVTKACLYDNEETTEYICYSRLEDGPTYFTVPERKDRKYYSDFVNADDEYDLEYGYRYNRVEEEIEVPYACNIALRFIVKGRFNSKFVYYGTEIYNENNELVASCKASEMDPMEDATQEDLQGHVDYFADSVKPYLAEKIHDIPTVDEMLDAMESLSFPYEDESFFDVYNKFYLMDEASRKTVAENPISDIFFRGIAYYDNCNGVGKGFGNLNTDEVVDAADALIALQFAVGKVECDNENFSGADVNYDYKVDASDALLILQYAVGKISFFPCNPKTPQ